MGRGAGWARGSPEQVPEKGIHTVERGQVQSRTGVLGGSWPCKAKPQRRQEGKETCPRGVWKDAAGVLVDVEVVTNDSQEQFIPCPEIEAE